MIVNFAWKCFYIKYYENSCYWDSHILRWSNKNWKLQILYRARSPWQEFSRLAGSLSQLFPMSRRDLTVGLVILKVRVFTDGCLRSCRQDQVKFMLVTDVGDKITFSPPSTWFSRNHKIILFRIHKIFVNLIQSVYMKLNVDNKSLDSWRFKIWWSLFVYFNKISEISKALKCIELLWKILLNQNQILFPNQIVSFLQMAYSDLSCTNN